MSFVVQYSDVAVGAKEAFSVVANTSLPGTSTNNLKKDGFVYSRYDVPAELNSMLLDGNAVFLPADGSAAIGYISNDLSDSDGNFVTPISVGLLSSSFFTSPGITFVFDEKKNIYPTHVKITWYDGSNVISERDFYPDNADFFCENRVEHYSRIVAQFFSLNFPNTRLRINAINYGRTVVFGQDELRSAKCIQEIDPISTSIPINTFDFSIDSQKNIDFLFQPKQPVELVIDGVKKSVTFVKSASRKSKTIWDIQSEDYISIMDTTNYRGGMYYNKSASELIDDILSTAKVPYEITGDFSSAIVDGYIPYTTCRDALMQVIFAIGAIADTSNSGKLKIMSLSDEESQNISKSRLLQGQSFENEPTITAVEILSHKYIQSEETMNLYEAEDGGTGNNIFVVFPEPMHSLTISNGTIYASGTNYAIIAAVSGCVLTGKKYQHLTTEHTKKNPLALSTDVDNIMAIENSTLVSPRNVDNVLNRCYNYLVKTDKTKMKIVDGRNDKSTNVGDLISYGTEYLGEKSGRIIKQTFSAGGGIIIKDSEVR